MTEYTKVYVRKDGCTLSAEEYLTLVMRETNEAFPQWWEENEENYENKEHGFKVLFQKMCESDFDYKVVCKCSKCGELVGVDEGHDWDHEEVLVKAVVNGIKFAVIVVDANEKTAAEAVWGEDGWDTDFSYPHIGVEAIEVAEALDFSEVRKLGYTIIE